MEEKYRKLFFKYIYDLLNLQEYEEELVGANIEYIDKENIMCAEEIICSKISKYFYLLNEVDLSSLTDDEKAYLNIIHDDIVDENVIKFLQDTYERVLLNHSPNSKTYYGPLMNPDFEADNDAVAIGIKYNAYGLAKGYKKEIEQIESEDKIVLDIMKRIEESSKIKIKLIRYDELYEFLNRNDPLSMKRR